MNKKIKIRFGYVPEYPNLAVGAALMTGRFKEAGIEVNILLYPNGSGPMALDLDEDRLDMGTLLTESATTSFYKGKRLKIADFLTETPILWGFHTVADSAIKDFSDMKNSRFRIAISRMFSGSYLMAMIYAKKWGIVLTEKDFFEANNLNGAVGALLLHEAHIFPWEKYTTKYLVDQGVFKLIDVFPSPWAGFTITVSEKICAEEKEAVKRVIDIIHQTAKDLRNGSLELSNLPLSETIAQIYHLQLPDVEEMLDSFRWVEERKPRKEIIRSLESVVDALHDIKVIDKDAKRIEDMVVDFD